VNPLYRLIFAALGLLVFAAQAVAQETRVAAAADADVIAVYCEHVERRLLRAHVDRAAGRISLVPFGPPGVETFAVAPNGAFVVYSATQDQGAGTLVTSLFLLDEAGQALGEPLRSPVGAVAGLAISPKGDRTAVSSNRGWLALLAVEGNGQARRLALSAEIGVSADRQFTYAFRPDGGLVTIVDDWLATYRASDGAVQRTLDLKTVNRDLTLNVPAGVDIRSQVAVLAWDQPRGEATLYVRPGAGVGVRRRATRESPGEAPDAWDEVVVGFGDPESLATEIAGYGPDVVAVAPDAVRDAVVRRLTAVLEAAS
jgi:hypothetical protein